MSTTPPLPSRKSPPSGIRPKVMNAGTMVRIGARRNTHGRTVRDEVLLEDDLEAVGEGLEDAERAGAVGADAVLEVRDDLALEPDHQHGGEQA
jgi:hypothetical protein